MNFMKLAAVCSVTVLMTALALPASAFELKVKSENPQLSEAAIRSAVGAVAGEIGQNIPDDTNIKVYVYSKALDSKITGQMIYFHRVQLTKAVSGGEPYPVSAWLPVKTVERFGVDGPEQIRAQLDAALRDFFTQMKSISPQKGFE